MISAYSYNNKILIERSQKFLYDTTHLPRHVQNLVEI